MTKLRLSMITMLSCLVVVVALSACARRPTITQASAPAPTPPPAAAVAPPVVAAPAPQALEVPAPTVVAAPARPAPKPREFEEHRALADIYFDFDDHRIRRDAINTLETSADWLRKNPEHLVLIEGHCDERGTTEYNLALGDRRAKAAQNYLVSLGVARERIAIVSYGEDRPGCTESSAACWAKNRRAHFLVKAGE